MSWKNLRTLAAQATEPVAAPAAGAFKDLPGAPKRAEVRFEGLSTNGGPTNTIFHFWRLFAGKSDRLLALDLAAALSNVAPRTFDLNGGDLAVTVELVGGVAPINVTGTLEFRALLE